MPHPPDGHNGYGGKYTRHGQRDEDAIPRWRANGPSLFPCSQTADHTFQGTQLCSKAFPGFEID
jgi:hypothetical protein